MVGRGRLGVDYLVFLGGVVVGKFLGFVLSILLVSEICLWMCFCI